MSGERGEVKENIAQVEDEGFQKFVNCNNEEKNNMLRDYRFSYKY